MSNRLVELRALLAKATFTMPMQVLSDNGKPVDMTPGEDGYVYIPELASLGDTGIAFVNDYEDRQHDAALIVAAVNALPALLDVAEAAERFMATDKFNSSTDTITDRFEAKQRLAAALSRVVPNVHDGER